MNGEWTETVSEVTTIRRKTLSVEEVEKIVLDYLKCDSADAEVIWDEYSGGGISGCTVKQTTREIKKV